MDDKTIGAAKKLTAASVSLTCSHPRVVMFKRHAFMFCYLLGIVGVIWMFVFTAPPALPFVGILAFTVGYILETSYRFDSRPVSAPRARRRQE